MGFVVFNDRAEAGKAVALSLQEFKDRSDVLVVALPRGGVVVGAEIARSLGCLMDVLPVCKLVVPGTQDLEMGAVAMGGTYFLHEDTIREFSVPADAVASAIDDQRKQVDRLAQLYRGTSRPPSVAGKIAIIVDDGLAGGAMMQAAIGAIRTQFPARVFLVVPVCAREICTALAAHVDRVVCLSEPIPFERLPVYYRSFPEVTDAEVQGLLRSCLNFTRGATDGARRNLSADALLTWKRGWELDL